MTTVWTDRKKNILKFHAYCWKLTFIIPTPRLWKRQKNGRDKEIGHDLLKSSIMVCNSTNQQKKRITFHIGTQTPTEKYIRRYGSRWEKFHHLVLGWINPFQKKNQAYILCIHVCLYSPQAIKKEEMNRKK